MQLRKHGEAILADGDASQPLRSIALWSEVNLRAADYGERELGDRYLRLRFEDLCGTRRRSRDDPPLLRAGGRRRGDRGRGGAAPGTFGRWRAEDPETTAALTERAAGALARFGYQSSSA